MHFNKYVILYSCLFVLTVFSEFSFATLEFTDPPSFDDQELSTDPDNPTVLKWGYDNFVVWIYSANNSCDSSSITQEWCVQNENNETSCFPATSILWWNYGYPAEELEQGLYSFTVTITDCEDSITSETYYIFVEWPEVIEWAYKDTREEFRGILAHLEQTSFMSPTGLLPHVIHDTPDVPGCDNPSMFYADGRLNILFGGAVRFKDNGTKIKSDWFEGTMAFAESIVPEKNINLSHNRNWVTDTDTGAAKPLVVPGTDAWLANNTGGAVVPHPSGQGKRLWFGTYDYKSDPDNKIQKYKYYLRVGFAYTDDNFTTTVPVNQKLILWERSEDPDNVDTYPNPFLGYSMKVFKEHLYVMMPRSSGQPVLLRCHLDDLANFSLNNWHYLVSADSSGNAVWSSEGITRNQISDPNLPTVDFGERAPPIVQSVFWNPYMNRWIATKAQGGLSLWESPYYWGPYKNITQPAQFNIEAFTGYNCFSDETMLGNNGEWIYYGRARARVSGPLGSYGSYFHRMHLEEELSIDLSTKSAIAGDTVTITCTNRSDLVPDSTDQITVTVAGNPATFSQQNGNDYVFSYTLTGDENGAQQEPGAVNVAATMVVPRDDQTDYHVKRDVALIVNHINEIDCQITSHQDDQEVSGWAFIDATVAYDAVVEDLGPGRPEVRIIKTELRYENGSIDVVEDADTTAPYQLKVDSRRYANGSHTFKVIAYDTLDRRGIATVTLTVNNPEQAVVEGNLIVDGNMEAAGVSSWQSYNGAVLTKVSDDKHRSGQQSLLIHSDNRLNYSGMYQVVSGLTGGESLRLTAWSRLKNNLGSKLKWQIFYQSNNKLITPDNETLCSSYGAFRRFSQVFTNPPGNTELKIYCFIRDTGSESTIAGDPVTTVEAIIDDVVLRDASLPLVAAPTGLEVVSGVLRNSVVLTWDAGTDVNLEYYYIYRKLKSETEWGKLAEGRDYYNNYIDTELNGTSHDYEYQVTAVDYMATESEAAQASAARAFDLHDNFGYPDYRIYSVGERGTILGYDGSALTPMLSGTTETINSVYGGGWMTYAVGSSGTFISKYEWEQNLEWYSFDAGTTADLNGVWCIDSSNVLPLVIMVQLSTMTALTGHPSPKLIRITSTVFGLTQARMPILSVITALL